MPRYLLRKRSLLSKPSLRKIICSSISYSMLNSTPNHIRLVGSSQAFPTPPQPRRLPSNTPMPSNVHSHTHSPSPWASPLPLAGTATPAIYRQSPHQSSTQLSKFQTHLVISNYSSRAMLNPMMDTPDPPLGPEMQLGGDTLRGAPPAPTSSGREGVLTGTGDIETPGPGWKGKLSFSQEAQVEFNLIREREEAVPNLLRRCIDVSRYDLTFCRCVWRV